MVAYSNGGSIPSITLNKLPDDLFQRLKEIAKAHRRSLSKELVVTLEEYVRHSGVERDLLLERIREVRLTGNEASSRPVMRSATGKPCSKRPSKASGREHAFIWIPGRPSKWSIRGY